MLSAISSAVTQMITWVGSVITALTAESGALSALLPIFAIGISVSILLVSVKIIRKVCWGS